MKYLVRGMAINGLAFWYDFDTKAEAEEFQQGVLLDGGDAVIETITEYPSTFGGWL